MIVEKNIMHKIENNRMIPIIDNEGIIKGSYLMINY